MQSEKIEKYEARKRTEEDKKVASEVFDLSTLFVLTKLISDGVIDCVEFPISTGKESNVFRARTKSGFLALKIYRTTTNIFKDLRKYVIGDPRFAEIKKKDIIFIWAKKEYKNLIRMQEAGVRVPEPVLCRANVLVMEYIGDEYMPAPMLKDTDKIKNPQMLFKNILRSMKKAYQKGNIVHGDMSEYNILMNNGKPVIIDVGQAVVTEHPLAQELLVSDVTNILRYFKRLGIKSDLNKILKEIKGE